MATVRKTSRLLARRLRRAQGGDFSDKDDPEAPDSEPDAPEPYAHKPKQPGPSMSRPPPAAKSKEARAQTISGPSKSKEQRTQKYSPPGPVPSARSGPPVPEPSPLSALLSPGQPSDYESLLNKKGRASLLRKIIFPKSIEEYLNEYQKYQAGAAATARRVETAQSKVSRVRAFLYFLSRKKQNLYTWAFMADMDAVRQ